MAGAVHRRPVIWAALFAIALTLFCAGASRATATSHADCQNVQQPKIVPGITPILFVHGINRSYKTWISTQGPDGGTVAGTSEPPMSYVVNSLGTGNVAGYTFDWSAFSGLNVGSKVRWVRDPPSPTLGDLLAKAIRCVASHAGHKVIIIAHSMGGLLSENASHIGNTANDIAAAFTLGTPYQGSWLASGAVGQGPYPILSPLTQALSVYCTMHLPNISQRPVKLHPKKTGGIEELCHYVSERNDPGIVGMRLTSNRPSWNHWNIQHVYRLASSIQGVWQPLWPVRINVPLTDAGDWVVSASSQIDSNSGQPTAYCPIKLRSSLSPPVASTLALFDAVTSLSCFHINEPYNKTLLDNIIGTIRSKHMIPTASISSPTKSPTPPPSLPQHWQQVRTLTDPTSGDISNIAVSPTGDLLATCAFDGSSYLWNMTSGQMVATITQANSTDSVHSLAFTPDGRTLATGFGGGSIALRDVATMATIAAFNDNVGNGAVSSLAFSPDGKILAAADLGGNGAYLWDVASGSQIALLSTSIGAVTAVAFSPDGKTLAVGGDNGTVLWNVATQHPIATLGTSGSGPIISTAFSPDDKTLATGGFTGTVLWNVATQHKVAVIRNLRMPADTTAVSFSPDSAILATAGTPTALWAAATGVHIATLSTTSGSAAFSRHGQTLVTTSGHSAIVWMPG